MVKRDYGIKMKLVPSAAGCLDVHLNIGRKDLVFIISSSVCHYYKENIIKNVRFWVKCVQRACNRRATETNLSEFHIFSFWKQKTPKPA